VVRVKGVAIWAVAAGGLGLFGTGVHGLVEVDGKLAGAAERPAADRPAAREIRNAPGAKDDCPQPERKHQRRFERRSL
jgi:hypothetical protein